MSPFFKIHFSPEPDSLTRHFHAFIIYFFFKFINISWTILGQLISNGPTENIQGCIVCWQRWPLKRAAWTYSLTPRWCATFDSSFIYTLPYFIITWSMFIRKVDEKNYIKNIWRYLSLNDCDGRRIVSSTSFWISTYLLLHISSSSVKKMSSIHCHKGWLILHRNSSRISLFLIMLSYFLGPC